MRGNATEHKVESVSKFTVHAGKRPASGTGRVRCRRFLSIFTQVHKMLMFGLWFMFKSVTGLFVVLEKQQSELFCLVYNWKVQQ